MDRTYDGKPFRMLCVIDELTRECLAVHQRQYSKWPLIEKPVRDKVHRPDVIRRFKLGPTFPIARCAPSSGCFRPNATPFLALKPINPFVIHRPPFPVQKQA